MEDKNLEKYLALGLSEKVEPRRLEETIKCCTEIMREQKKAPKEEDRTSFIQYLSDVFCFEGIPMFILQAATLLVVCLTIISIADSPQNIPIFMPLFVLVVIPILFKSQYYKMNEIEATTRASGAQVMLAKLVLAGGANLVCMTMVVCVEVLLQNSCKELGQMILYCLVPYLVCMSGLLRVVRLQKKESLLISVVAMPVSCICWALSSKVIPWLYTSSAIGVWGIAFLIFSAFFIKEVIFIVKMRKEGKMYGIVA